MTQLDVPTISFTHYLDLLKRRTWHVIIVSVLGLVVGGVVAMLIPRYYVAETRVELNRPILDPKLGTPLDPFSQLISAAIVKVPDGVPSALRELKWLEAFTGTAEDKRSFIAQVRSRVSVMDKGPGNKGRRIAHLLIVYRDLDGQRAADMTNKLRDIWLKEFVEGLKTKAEAELQVFVREKQAKQTEKLRIAREKRQFEEDHGINPADWQGARQGMVSLLTGEGRAMQIAIAQLKIDINALHRKIAARQRELDVTSPTLRADVTDLLQDPGMRQAYMLQLAIVNRATLFLKGVTPAHPEYETYETALKSAREQLAEIQKVAGGEAPDRPNPVYSTLKAEQLKLKDELAIKEDTLLDKNKEFARLSTELKTLPKIYEQYKILREREKMLQLEENQLNLKLAEKRTMITRIKSERPEILTPAHVPPTPTDPDPLMLALMGCIVGLAAAIGLVILIDFLQMSFKSVADVESGLGLPVLGTISYLETDEEADSTRDRRTLVTISGILFLVLLLTIVTLYYVMPTSLPPIVNEILSHILGEPKR